jgi:hypothetical protein
MSAVRNIFTHGIAALALVLAISPFSAQAREHGRDRGPVHFETSSGLHLYTGGDVNITESAKDAIIAAGGQIDVDKVSAADIIAAGGDVELRGVSVGRVIAAGGDVEINGDIKTSVIAAGGHVKVPEGTKIGGDMLVAGGDLNLAAAIKGDLMAAGGNIDLNGNIGGNAILRSRFIDIDPATRIAGNLTYSSPEELKLADGIVSGTVTREEWRGNRSFAENFGVRNIVAIAIVAVIGAIVALFMFAFVALVIFAPVIGRAGKSISEEPLQSFGLGMLLAIMMPFVVIVLVITIIGIPLAVFAGAIFAILFGLGLVTAAYWIGLRLRKWTKGSDEIHSFGGRLIWTLAGLVAFSVVGLVPILGNLAQLLAVLMGLGAIVLCAWSGRDDGLRSNGAASV